MDASCEDFRARRPAGLRSRVRRRDGRPASAAGPSSAHPTGAYLHAFSAALGYEIGVFLLAALLMSLLPRAARTGAPSGPPPDHAESGDTP